MSKLSLNSLHKSLLLPVRLPRRIKYSQTPLVIFILACMSIIVIYYTLYFREEYLFPLEPIPFQDKEAQINKKVVIFPKNCHLRNDQLINYYINTLQRELFSEDVIFKNKFSFELKDVSYNPSSMVIFETSDEKTCKPQTVPFEVSRPYTKNANLYRILKKFVDDNSDYYREMLPFFPDIEKQLKRRDLEKHWFQMVGSSVWLEQYGVHFMISRIFYTKTGDKVKPVMSLSYVQIFDSNWNELENVDLIVPNDITGPNEPEYKSISYPNFLPMPVYHNVSLQKGRFYGVEDPRIILVKNYKGNEEPIIIFNSYNRKISGTKNYKDILTTVNLDMYRSMFMSWLWRTQKGKGDVDGILNASHLKDTYIKIKELKLPSEAGTMKKEKNWTPFTDYEYRLKSGYDKDINLVYQFEDLKIVRCSLLDHERECKWEYQRDEESLPNAKRLRGGTELISLNELLDHSNFNELQSLKHKINKENSQIWIGFARVVLKNCGCGVKMYRPNFVVLIKDNKGYSISMISSFMDLTVPIIPWFEAQSVCAGKNLLVPNGISSWKFSRDDSGNVQDYLTVSLSRSDTTVDIVYVKGLLMQILSREIIPSSVEIKNDYNVQCAIKASKMFCKEYGIYADEHHNQQVKSLASDLFAHMNNIAHAMVSTG